MIIFSFLKLFASESAPFYPLTVELALNVCYALDNKMSRTNPMQHAWVHHGQFLPFFIPSQPTHALPMSMSVALSYWMLQLLHTFSLSCFTARAVGLALDLEGETRARSKKDGDEISEIAMEGQQKQKLGHKFDI